MRGRFEQWFLNQCNQPDRPFGLWRWFQHLLLAGIAGGWMWLWVKADLGSRGGQLSLGELFVLTIFAGTPTWLIVDGLLERLRRFLIWWIEDGALAGTSRGTKEDKG